MNSFNFLKNRYQAGFEYGKKLREQRALLERLEFSLERMDYAKRCVAVYDREFPEILREIKGIADGSGVSIETLYAFLFGMYSYTAGNFCSCAAVKTAGDRVLFARNSDFLTAVESACQSGFYRLEDACAFIGNTTAFCEIEDGVNEKGLAVGLTFIYSEKKTVGINAGMLVRLLLERADSVAMALRLLREVTVGSSQTLTLADKNGDLAVVELTAEEMAVIRPGERECVFTTNHFNLLKGVESAPKLDLYSHLRYHVIEKAMLENEYSLDFMRDLFSGRHGFTCQYDRSSGSDTVWSVLYDLTDERYFRCEGNPSREEYHEDKRLAELTAHKGRLTSGECL